MMLHEMRQHLTSPKKKTEDSDLKLKVQRQQATRCRRVTRQDYRHVLTRRFRTAETQVAADLFDGCVATTVAEDGKEVLWRGS